MLSEPFEVVNTFLANPAKSKLDCDRIGPLRYLEGPIRRIHMKITKSQIQVLHAPADEALVDVQPKSGGMRA